MQPPKPIAGRPANWHGKGLARVSLLIVALLRSLPSPRCSVLLAITVIFTHCC
jgi:hypothetical protein